MKEKIKNKKKKILILILIILLIIGIYYFLKNDDNFFKDDIIFFKNFYSSINNTKENKDTNENDSSSDDYNIIKISTKKQTTKEMTLFSNLEDQMNWNYIQENTDPSQGNTENLSLVSHQNFQKSLRRYRSLLQQP